MKKRRLRVVTIAALLAALFGSGGGIAWGQTQVPVSWSDCNNDYGADESTTISPPATNANGTPVAIGSMGRITLGGNTRNQVLYVANAASMGQLFTGRSTPCGYLHPSGNITDANDYFTYCNPAGGTKTSLRHIAGGGSGSISAVSTGAFAAEGGQETHIQIASGGLVEMEHFYFNPIKWYYRRSILREWDCSVSCSWTDGGGNTHVENGPAKCSSKTTTESYEGGYVDGHITVLAGATVSLTGHVSNLGIKNTAGNTPYPNQASGSATASKLTLPTGANPYTLQVKQLFDANSFNTSVNIDGIPDMAQQAVLGLWTGINNPAITDAGVGGTFLIGNATQFQNQLTLNSGTNGGTLANYYHHTNTEQRPGGSWDNKSITTTDAVVHDVNISGTSGGTHITFNLNSTGDMTIENTQCAALNFNGKFAPAIGVNGAGALRINPRTWTTTGNLEYPTVFSPLNLPPVLPTPTGSAVRGHTHFAEDVELNFTTKTGFLLL